MEWFEASSLVSQGVVAIMAFVLGKAVRQSCVRAVHFAPSSSLVARLSPNGIGVVWRRQCASDERSDGRLPSLTLHQAVNCQRLVAETLSDDDLKEKLAVSRSGAHSSGHDLVARWQRVLTIVQMVKSEAISRHGFPATAHGLLQYETQLARLIVSKGQLDAEEQLLREELSTLLCQSWTLVLERAFGVSGFRQISLAEARTIAAHLDRASANEDFLRRVDESLRTVGESTSRTKRHATVLDMVVPLHTSVLSQYGFPGESGYLAFMAALMEHVIDETVAHRLLSASEVVFKRAGLVRHRHER